MQFFSIIMTLYIQEILPFWHWMCKNCNFFFGLFAPIAWELVWCLREVTRCFCFQSPNVAWFTYIVTKDISSRLIFAFSALGSNVCNEELFCITMCHFYNMYTDFEICSQWPEPHYLISVFIFHMQLDGSMAICVYNVTLHSLLQEWKGCR